MPASKSTERRPETWKAAKGAVFAIAAVLAIIVVVAQTIVAIMAMLITWGNGPLAALLP